MDFELRVGFGKWYSKFEAKPSTHRRKHVHLIELLGAKNINLNYKDKLCFE